MRNKTRFLLVTIMCCVMVFICSGCSGNYADKIISPQITATVGHNPVITTVSREIPMSNIKLYFASRGGAEFIGPREIIIYNPVAITGEYGGKIGGRIAWAVAMRPVGNNIIISIPSDADYHIYIDGRCITLKKEVE